jgi:hypothetical protein
MLQMAGILGMRMRFIQEEFGVTYTWKSAADQQTRQLLFVCDSIGQCRSMIDQPRKLHNMCVPAGALRFQSFFAASSEAKS